MTDDPDVIRLRYATPESGVPTALKIVAWIFIVTGIATIIHIIAMFAYGRFTLDTGVLGVFVGPGLLRFSRGWRTCALVLLWFGLIVIPIVTVMILFSPGSVNANLFGISVGSVPPIAGFLFGVLMFVLVVWEYRVLVRDDIRRRFGLTTS